jgi:hypothetical protein
LRFLCGVASANFLHRCPWEPPVESASADLIQSFLDAAHANLIQIDHIVDEALIIRWANDGPTALLLLLLKARYWPPQRLAAAPTGDH